ncbi:MAG: flagellar biosynthetic protein FliQ [Pseudomonadota bacterium]
MNEADVIEIVRQAFVTTLAISAPPLLAGTLTGVAIALFQALTQIQEMTLTFVPKFLAIFVSIMVSLPFIFHALGGYASFVADRIIAGR